MPNSMFTKQSYLSTLLFGSKSLCVNHENHQFYKVVRNILITTVKDSKNKFWKSEVVLRTTLARQKIQIENKM